MPGRRCLAPSFYAGLCLLRVRGLLFRLADMARLQVDQFRRFRQIRLCVQVALLHLEVGTNQYILRVLHKVHADLGMRPTVRMVWDADWHHGY